ncbi:venom serine protease-like isoform X2 [Vespula maculifrons]|uniref:Venom serine protease-like isoform X2 n=1 Tax=Vespula maculifrons TaxID=7453 RepID=A0ABD2AT64_VESMC
MNCKYENEEYKKERKREHKRFSVVIDKTQVLYLFFQVTIAMKQDKFIPLFCVLLSIIESKNIVHPDCDYTQELEPEVNYHIYNPGYPNYYLGKHNCRWSVTSNTRIKLNCTVFNVPSNSNCSLDFMKIEVDDGIEYVLCGLNSFPVESLTSKMTIEFHSKRNTYGGKFQCDLKTIEEECRCGWTNPSRIVGGVETGINEYPMMAGIVNFEKSFFYCGATIITTQHVLTAAHCVVRYIKNFFILGVIVGKHNIWPDNDTKATQLYLIDDIIIHPNYKLKLNDLAVIKLQKRLEYSMRIGPACLPFYYMQQNFTGAVVTAVGWGRTNFYGVKSQVLRKVDLHVVSTKKCLKYHFLATPKQLCTFDMGKDACQFDSGGPILWQNPKSKRIFLLGVINYGRTCADEAPGVNLRVTSYLDFITRSTPGKVLKF